MRNRTRVIHSVVAVTCLGAIGTLASAQTVEQTPQWTNTGEFRVPEFTGHVLTAPGSFSRGGAILYCPSEADDAGYRAAISAAAGGVTVDYFDARAATPDLPTLSNYDCVYTWTNFAYLDNVLMGDNLALFSDGGGTVVLGSFCTYTSGNFLSGNIMGPTYCPVVSPTGTNHFTLSRYQSDGTTCIYDNVVSPPGIIFRDILALQGGGVADGSYADGEICHAYQANASSASMIVYSNGCGASQLLGSGGGGDWPIVVANSCTCFSGCPAAASAEVVRNGAAPNPVAFNVGVTSGPVTGQTWDPIIDHTTFMPASALDVMGVTVGTLDLPLPPWGSLLIDITTNPTFYFFATPGSAFAVPIPADCALHGFGMSSQGASIDAGGAVGLTNAIDITFGSF